MCAGQYGSITRVVAPKVYDKISPTKSIDRKLGLGPQPMPEAPPLPQEVKQPDFASLRAPNRRRGAGYGGTLLTGPSGVSLNSGAPTLLGG